MAKRSKQVNHSKAIWEIESIPQTAVLYRFVHQNLINPKTGNPYERVFENTPKGGTDFSTDWDKYSSPQETRERLALQPRIKGGFKNPLEYFIYQFRVDDIRKNIPSQSIQHDPIQDKLPLPDNRSHTIVIGEKDVEIRLKFMDIFEWIIPPD